MVFYYVKSCCIFLFWITFRLSKLGLVGAQLPNDGCRIRRTGSDVTLSCFAANFELPGNFDVNLLDSTITTLSVRSRSDLSVVHGNYVPLPSRDNLTAVLFHFFNLMPADPRFPLDGILVHNKQHIQDLTLMSVKLGYLSKNDFSGFNQLRSLILNRNNLSYIDLNTFEGLGDLPAGGHPVEAQLWGVDISGNHGFLRALDWSFLKPVAKSVEHVYLSHNDFTTSTLTCSSHFVLERAGSFSFTFNPLERLPSEVFRTFNISRLRKHQLELNGGEDCNTTLTPVACTCADVEEMTNWLMQSRRLADVFNLDECPSPEASNEYSAQPVAWMLPD